MINRNLHAWIPDAKDPRDIPYAAIRPLAARMLGMVAHPRTYDLVITEPQNWPAIYDQSTLGSCVYNGWSGAIGYAEAKEGNGPIVVSRLAPYWHYRNKIGRVNEDTGSTIRDGIKTIAKFGVPVETLWPYDLTKWTVKPSDAAESEGRHRRVGLLHASLRGVNEIVDCIATGYPVVFGTVLFDSFESVNRASPVVPMPTESNSVIGGHCMVFVGYDLGRKRFRVRNSWGASWAEDGYCYMPFEYVTACASDFRTVRKIAK